MTAPFDKLRVPVYVWPLAAATLRWLGPVPNMMLIGLPLVVAPALPAAAIMHPVAGTKELTAPAYVMVTRVIDAAAGPVLVTVIVFVPPATLHVGAAGAPAVKSAATRAAAVTAMSAELYDDPDDGVWEELVEVIVKVETSVSVSVTVDVSTNVWFVVPEFEV